MTSSSYSYYINSFILTKAITSVDMFLRMSNIILNNKNVKSPDFYSTFQIIQPRDYKKKNM